MADPDTPIDPPEPEMPEKWRSTKGKPSFFGMVTRMLLLTIIALALVLPFTPYARKIKQSLKELVLIARGPVETQVVTKEVIKEVEVPKEVIKEVKVEVPAPPPPLPSKYIDRKEVDIASLFNGITVKTELLTEQGTYASLERLDPEAYKAQFQISIRVPRANQTIEELARINEDLPKILPGLESMLEGAEVSPFYHKLYENKTERVKREVTRLNKALDRHNFYDCETILEMTHPVSGRKAMLIQSEMDVVADGSDGDRMPSLDEYIYMSDYYQPFTSYAWPKTSKTPNPLLKRWQSRLAEVKAEYAIKGLTAERNRQLRASIEHLELEIQDMKYRSSLIAEKDPFIVISLLFHGYATDRPHTPKMGDYAAVIHGNKIYPAICGDYGPTFKMGEASLLMAKTINDRATPYNRPESDLKVTYLIFTGTGKKPWKAPNLAEWQEKVAAYLDEVGGVGEGYEIYQWEDPFKEPEPVVAAETPSVNASASTSLETPAANASASEAVGGETEVIAKPEPAETLAPAQPAN